MDALISKSAIVMSPQDKDRLAQKSIPMYGYSGSLSVEAVDGAIVVAVFNFADEHKKKSFFAKVRHWNGIAEQF